MRRKALSLTLEQVAEKAELSPNYLGRVENEQVAPSLPVAVQLSKALGLPISALVGDEGMLRDSGARSSRAIELQSLLGRLADEQRDAVLVIARALAAKTRKKK